MDNITILGDSRIAEQKATQNLNNKALLFNFEIGDHS